MIGRSDQSKEELQLFKTNKQVNKQLEQLRLEYPRRARYTQLIIEILKPIVAF